MTPSKARTDNNWRLRGKTMADIYEQHRAAFVQVAAYVVMHKGERVATIAFKFPRDGAGRLYAYVHWIGLEMVRGYAGGFGYDKRSAACASAADRLQHKACAENYSALGFGLFWQTLAKDGGQTWDSALREAGFEVLQAV